MKFILKPIFYFLFFIIMLIVFLPKANIYYFGLEQLKKYKVELMHSSIDDAIFSLGINDIKINYEDVEVADISQAKLNLYIYETSIDVNNIIVDESFSKFIPRSLKSVQIVHNILDPLVIKLNAKFNLGSCDGTLDILNRVIYLKINVANSFKVKYKHLINQLKRSDESTQNEEVYTYEYKF